MKPTINETILAELRDLRKVVDALKTKVDLAAPVWEQAAWGTNGEFAKVKRAVETAFGLPDGAIDAPTREERIVWPRQIAMLLVHEIYGTTSQRIASAFGKRDHGTVTHAWALVKTRERQVPKVRVKLQMLREHLARNGDNGKHEPACEGDL